MEKTNYYREYLEAAYKRVISGKLSDDELCEEAIVLYKGSYRCDYNGKEVSFWGDEVMQWSEMPSDCFCELVKTPTHIAVSILIYSWLHSEKTRNFAPLKETIEKGLLGASYIGFKGHGYEAEEDFAKNMKYYEKVDTLRFCDRYSSLCQNFTDTYVKRHEEFAEETYYDIWSGQIKTRD